MCDRQKKFKTRKNFNTKNQNRGEKSKTDGRIKAGISLIYRAIRDENTPARHHARGYNRFRDIRLQFTSVRPILENYFPDTFSFVFHRP